MFWTPEFLKDVITSAKNMVSSFEYEMNGQWKSASIVSITSGFHDVSFLIEIPSAASGVVTCIRARGTNGDIIGLKRESLNKSSDRTLVYKLKMKISEGVI